MSGVLSAIVIGAGLGSAALWLWSALVPIPKGTIFFTSHAGGGTANAEVEKLMAALRRQSRLSAAAAVLAAIAVLAQVGQQVMTQLH